MATSDFGGGSANASSAGSKTAIPPTAIPNAAISPVIVAFAPNRGMAIKCASQNARCRAIGRKMRRFRSLNVQGRCGTLGATEHFIAIIPMRKVTP